MHNRVQMLNIEIDNLTMDEALDKACVLIKDKSSSYIVTPNVDHLMILQEDSLFKEIYSNAAMILCDGKPIQIASKIIGTPIKEKISGSDFFPRLCEKAAEKGYSVFFLGAEEGVAQKAAEILGERLPQLKVTGTYSPPFGFENNINEIKKIISLINSTNTNILFVGLGAPKQEKFIWNYKDKLKANLYIGIGNSFNFIAGDIKRAPEWMQKMSLEWLWRMLTEPKSKNLWKRYLHKDLKFLYWYFPKFALKKLLHTKT